LPEATAEAELKDRNHDERVAGLLAEQAWALLHLRLSRFICCSRKALHFRVLLGLVPRPFVRTVGVVVCVGCVSLSTL